MHPGARWPCLSLPQASGWRRCPTPATQIRCHFLIFICILFFLFIDIRLPCCCRRQAAGDGARPHPDPLSPAALGAAPKRACTAAMPARLLRVRAAAAACEMLPVRCACMSVPACKLLHVGAPRLPLDGLAGLDMARLHERSTCRSCIILHPALGHPHDRAAPPHMHPWLQGWQVKVWRDYERFIADLTALFPHEKEGIRALYDEFWKVGACRCFCMCCGGAAFFHETRIAGHVPSVLSIGMPANRSSHAQHPGARAPAGAALPAGMVTAPRVPCNLPATAGVQRPQHPGAQVAGGAAVPAGAVCRAPAGLPHPRILCGLQHRRHGAPPHQGKAFVPDFVDRASWTTTSMCNLPDGLAWLWLWPGLASVVASTTRSTPAAARPPPVHLAHPTVRLACPPVRLAHPRLHLAHTHLPLLRCLPHRTPSCCGLWTWSASSGAQLACWFCSVVFKLCSSCFQSLTVGPGVPPLVGTACHFVCVTRQPAAA